MSELPFELWTHISEYFSLDELTKLCGAHRAIFERLVDVKYRDAIMRGQTDEEVFFSLANPAVSRRVRSITLDTLNFKTFILFTPQHFQTLCSSHTGSSPNALTNIKSFLRRGRNIDEGMFPALETLCISVSSIYKYAPFMQRPDILRSADTLWRSVMKSPLTSLTLDVAIEAYRDDVIPASLFIPNLSNLKLVIWVGYASTDYKPYLSNKLAPLVNRHAGSLRCLSIEVQEAVFKVHPRYYDSSSLFRHLERLPKLDSVEVRVPLLTPSQTDLSDLSDFLRTHSQQVTELKLHLFHSLLHEIPFEPSLVHVYSEADLTKLPFFTPSSAVYPSLQVLEFSVFHRDPDIFPAECFLGWAQRHPCWKSVLRSLCLTSHYIPPADVIRVLSSVQFTALTHLSLSLRALPLQFLVQLQSTLLQLQELTLIVMHWIQKLTVNIEVASNADLVEDIRILSQDDRRLFTGWHLRHLAICIGRRSRRNPIRQDMERRKFLKELFPNVATVEYFDSYVVS